MVGMAHPKVFWLSKGDSSGHSGRKKTKDRRNKKWEDNIKEWTGMDFGSTTGAAIGFNLLDRVFTIS